MVKDQKYLFMIKFYHPGAILAKFYKINISACTFCPPHVITYLPELMWNRDIKIIAKVL